MIESLILTLREGTEAALIIGIIAAYLGKVGRKDLYRYLYIGTAAAVAASILVALIFGELYKISGEVFEGIAAFFAVVVLTYMIFWMAGNSKKIKGELQEKVDIFIAATDKDNVNIMFAQWIRNRFKVPRVIPRVYDPIVARSYRDVGLETVCPTDMAFEAIQLMIKE